MRVTSGVLTSIVCGAVFGTATSLVNNVPVEEAMGAAQVELESLAQRLSA